MSLEALYAYLAGYSDHLFNLQLLSIQQGYWAGYFTRAKRAKPLKNIIEELVRAHTEKAPLQPKDRPDVDVEAFLRTEQEFQKRLRGEYSGR